MTNKNFWISMKANGTRNQKTKVDVYTEEDTFLDRRHQHIQVISYQDKERAFVRRNGPHSHTYYEIIWVESGSGCHTIDFIKYPFNGPCLFLLHPGNIHCIGEGIPTVGGTIKFSDDFFFKLPEPGNFLMNYDIFDDVNVRPVINLTKEQASDLKIVFNETLKTYSCSSRISKEMLPHYVKIFLLKIYEIKIGEVNCSHHRSIDRDRFNTFRTLLEKHYREKHEVAFYLNAMHLSEKTLRNIANTWAGKAPSTLIQERLVLDAKRLLFHTTLSIKEIANQLGFEDASYFTRFFSKHAGVSPNRFRSHPEI